MNNSITRNLFILLAILTTVRSKDCELTDPKYLSTIDTAMTTTIRGYAPTITYRNFYSTEQLNLACDFASLFYQTSTWSAIELVPNKKVDCPEHVCISIHNKTYSRYLNGEKSFVRIASASHYVRISHMLDFSNFSRFANVDSLNLILAYIDGFDLSAAPLFGFDQRFRIETRLYYTKIQHQWKAN